MSRRRAEGQTRHGPSLSPDQILQMLADRLAVAQIVVLRQQAVEQRLVRGAPYPADVQSAELRQAHLQRLRLDAQNVRRLALRQRIVARAANRRQLDQSGPMQR